MEDFEKAKNPKSTGRHPIDLTPEPSTTMNDGDGGDAIRDDDASNAPTFDNDGDVYDEHI